MKIATHKNNKSATGRHEKNNGKTKEKILHIQKSVIFALLNIKILESWMRKSQSRIRQTKLPNSKQKSNCWKRTAIFTKTVGWKHPTRWHPK